MDADYAVIGGGLIGLITAQSLAFHGKKVLLFKEDHSTIQDKRAYGLTYGSLRRLDYLGLSLPLTTQIESLSLYFNQYKSHEINATAMNIPYLGANILHSVINDSFLTQLSPAITIVHEKVFGLTLDQHWSICTSLNNTYHVDYIAGSDGSESLVRRITSPLLAYEYTFPQTALVFHLTHSEEKSAEKAYQISLDNFLIGLLPLNQKQSYFVMTGPHQDIAALKNKIELEDHLPHFFQKNKIIHDLLSKAIIEIVAGPYPLKSYHVKQQINRRSFLIGLAAKSFHPAAAMGLNQSIYEIALINQMINRQKDEKELSWGSQFERNIAFKVQSIRYLTAALAFPWTRSLLSIAPFSTDYIIKHLSNFLA